MKRENIVVDNLKCGGCANSIRQMLLEIDGTVAVEVDEDTATVFIDHDEVHDHSFFVDKLAWLGYPEMGTTTMLQKAKSYVSCAKGRLQ